MDTQSPRIRVIVLCLLRHIGDPSRILVARERDTVAGFDICRPLGGGIEFGESAQDAVRREIREELGQEIEDVQLLGVIENPFVLDGRAHHEIVFLFDARFVDASLYEREELPGYEESAEAGFTAFWSTPEEMAARGEQLVPEELRQMLRPSCL